MQKAIKIKTKDGHYIYGTLTYPSEKIKKIIIFVHGMTGNSNEHHIFNCSRALNQQGFATCRFDLYTWRKGGRSFDECTIKTHSNDILEVKKFLRRRGYDSFGIVGHSLGAPSILLSELIDYQALVLWDPTSDEWMRKSFQADYNPKIKKYILNWGVRHLCSVEMVKDSKQLPNLYKIASEASLPTLIVAAQKGVLVEGCKKYYQAIKSKKKLTIIKGASHCFDEEGTEEQLIKETVKWFSKYCL
jgi:dienelactone hydrolase